MRHSNRLARPGRRRRGRGIAVARLIVGGRRRLRRVRRHAPSRRRRRPSAPHAGRHARPAPDRAGDRRRHLPRARRRRARDHAPTTRTPARGKRRLVKQINATSRTGRSIISAVPARRRRWPRRTDVEDRRRSRARASRRIALAGHEHPRRVGPDDRRATAEAELPAPTALAALASGDRRRTGLRSLWPLEHQGRAIASRRRSRAPRHRRRRPHRKAPAKPIGPAHARSRARHHDRPTARQPGRARPSAEDVSDLDKRIIEHLQAGRPAAVHPDRRRARRVRGGGPGPDEPPRRARDPPGRRRHRPAEARLPADGDDRHPLRERPADGRRRGARGDARGRLRRHHGRHVRHPRSRPSARTTRRSCASSPSACGRSTASARPRRSCTCGWSSSLPVGHPLGADRAQLVPQSHQRRPRSAPESHRRQPATMAAAGRALVASDAPCSTRFGRCRSSRSSALILVAVVANSR